MPKLSNEDYLVRHEMLHRVWGRDARPYSHLTYQQQRDLHDYYAPAKNLSNEELLVHRKRVTRKDPSLPQRASKAFLVMLRPDIQKDPTPVRTDFRGRKITVRSLARPQIGTEKLAVALLDMVGKMTPQQRAALAPEGRKILKERKRGTA